MQRHGLLYYSLFKMMPYERFEAWKAAHELALEVYRISDKWPVSERYQLTSQIRRAALSVPTNIAEGTAKRGSREFRYEETFGRLSEARHHVGKLSWGLYASLAVKSL